MTGQLSMTNSLRLSRTILLATLSFGASALAAQNSAPAASPTPATAAAPAQIPVVQAPASQGQESSEPQTLHLLVGRSLVITSPSRIKRISLADPEIAEAIVVSPTQVLV